MSTWACYVYCLSKELAIDDLTTMRETIAVSHDPYVETFCIVGCGTAIIVFMVFSSMCTITICSFFYFLAALDCFMCDIAVCVDSV